MLNNTLRRRDFVKSSALALAALKFNPVTARLSAAPEDPYLYLKGMRILLAEGYNPPFYPNLDYEPERALEIAKALNADSIRFPAAAYRAFFPTKTRYPRHPSLGDRDPYAGTIELCKRAGLKIVVYLPLNHPFLSTSIATPEQKKDWVKKNADGSLMQTEHYGFDPYYETCINSPIRGEILKMVEEAVHNYEPDIVYFDGPYQGMQGDMRWCQCEYCNAAYRKAKGRDLPLQDAKLTPELEQHYVNWMRSEVMDGFVREVKGIVKRKPVPMLFNNTSLLTSRQWRNLLYPMFDGFMFEAATTPEQKLFNILLGKSTGKHIWSYVGSHTVYNREHLRNQRIRGWFSYPIESEELQMDARVAIAAGAGLIYWGLARFFYMPEPLKQYESAGYVREAFDLTAKHRALIETLEPARDFGILVSGKTIDWLKDRGSDYDNYYYGAFQVLKDLHYQAEPFHDSQLDLAKLQTYRAVWAPNAVCLSDADCRALADYVRGGGLVIATHRTSLADEIGRPRKDFGLADVFGASFDSVFEYPDLYLRFDDSQFPGNVVPQDPQVVITRAQDPKIVLAETFDRGRNHVLGPAIIRRSFGSGQVIYIASGLEAVYLETRAMILKQLFAQLLDRSHPERLYTLRAPAGVWGHLAQAPDRTVLHIVANTGIKWKKLQSREQFVPVGPIEARIRISTRVKKAWRLTDGHPLEFRIDNGYAAVRLDKVTVHEAIVLE